MRVSAAAYKDWCEIKKLFCKVFLIVLAGCLAIVLLDVMIYHITQSQVRADAVSKYGEILDEASTKGAIILLVPAESGMYHLVVYEKSIWFDRYRIKEDTIYKQKELGNFALRDRFHVYALSVQEGKITIYTDTMRSRWTGELAYQS